MQKEAYKIIDEFLNHLIVEGSGSVYSIGEDFYSTPSQMAYKIMCDSNLITFRKGYPYKNSIIDISSHGLDIINMGGYEAYVNRLAKQKENDDHIRNLEVEKQRQI